jgi:hypothetical protein
VETTELDASIPRRLERYGFAFVQDVGSRSDARAVAEQLGSIRIHRDSDHEGATSITPTNGRDGPASQAFSRVGLAPHTDGSGVLRPADLVVNYVEHQAHRGGYALLTDGLEIFADLTKGDDGLLAALSRSEFAFGSHRLRASIVSGWDAGTHRRWSFRYRGDGELRPLTCRAATALESFAEIVRTSTWEIPTQSGDLYVTDNHRCLHGRTAFVGSRSVVRFLVDAPSLELGVALN